MHSKTKYMATIFWLLFVILPGSLCASTIYTYTSATVDISFDLTVNPDSITGGTIIDGDIAPGSFSMTYPPPPQDNAGFLLGTGPGYQSFTLSELQIGTDSGGNITSWDVTGTEFGSYPAFPGENPNDFFCEYNVSFTASGGSGPLSVDNDAGFCPSSNSALATGTWSAVGQVSGVPEPSNSVLLGSGFLGLLVLVTRRKRAAVGQ
jgi:hypothetical protein